MPRHRYRSWLTSPFSDKRSTDERFLGRVRANGLRSIARRSLIALPACEASSEHSSAACGCDYPGTIHPWRVMAHVLVVTAFKFRYPMQVLVLMKPDDAPVHWNLLTRTPFASDTVSDEDTIVNDTRPAGRRQASSSGYDCPA